MSRFPRIVPRDWWLRIEAQEAALFECCHIANGDPSRYDGEGRFMPDGGVSNLRGLSWVEPCLSDERNSSGAGYLHSAASGHP